jgi:hypothetical protein
VIALGQETTHFQQLGAAESIGPDKLAQKLRAIQQAGVLPAARDGILFRFEKSERRGKENIRGVRGGILQRAARLGTVCTPLGRRSKKLLHSLFLDG